MNRGNILIDYQIVKFLSIAAVALAVALSYKFRKNTRHKYKQNQAKKILKKISSFDSDAKIFSYLRKIDPFVFEEMILDGFENGGFKVIRNKKYTGDGGIDGKVIIDNQTCLIQSKRYKSYINPKHVHEFNLMCLSEGVSGFFCHTGRTSKALLETIKGDSNVVLVSGDRLINLLTKR